MTYTKLTTKDAARRFNSAESYLKLVQHDPNDPASENLIQALDQFFGAIASNQNEIINGLNDLLDRVDKLQQKLGK